MNFRHTNSADKEELAQLIAEEPRKAGRSIPEFWLPQDSKGIQCYAIADSRGATSYVRIENVLRFHLLLRQNEEFRTAKALAFLLSKVEHDAKGYVQLIGATDAEPLRNFLKKLGFSESPCEMTKGLKNG